MSTTAEHHPSITSATTRGACRAERRGRAVGIAVLAYFALAWTGWGMSTGVPSALEAPTIAVAALGSVALLVTAVLMYRRAASLPHGPDAAGGRTAGRRFGIIVGVEFGGLFLLAGLLAGTGHPQLVPAVVCFGVGVHFFPLRRLFHVPIYDRTGVALCLVALATAVAAPLADHPALWTMLPGIGAALTLYSTCALLLRTTHTHRPPV